MTNTISSEPRVSTLMLLSLALEVAGCGRLGFEAVPDAPVPRDTVAVDVGDALTVDCWPSWRAGTIAVDPPTLIAELAAGVGDSDPTLSADGRTLYYVRAGDLWSATRTGRGAPWTNAAAITELNSASLESRLTIDATGTIAIFNSDRSGNGDFYQATRGPVGPFGAPTVAPFLQVNTSNYEWDPDLSGDALTLYYAYGTSFAMHFARTSRTTTVAPFDPPTPVPEIEIGSSNADPMVSPDELVVAFSTDLTGNSDIYYARRGSTAVPFATPTPIPSIDDPSFHDADPNLSNDGCELLFSSDRSGGTELYSAIVH